MTRVARLALLIVLPLLAVAVAALAAEATFTPHDVARIRSVGAIAVSPDGSAVAYTLNVPRRPLVDEDGPAWEELHVAGRDGSSRPFVTGEVNVSAVRWTPDGKSLSFLSRRGKDKTRSLYLMRLDGGEARRVLTSESDIVAYSLSADGQRAAFVAREAPARAQRELEKKGFNQQVFEEDVPIQRVWIAGLGEAAGAAKPLDLPGSASNVLWSPTGSDLAVVLAPTPLVDDDLMQRRVHVVGSGTGAIVSSVNNPGKLGAIAWSPDGKSLALASGADLNDPGAGRLMVWSPGSGLKDLLPGYEGHVTALAWRDAGTIVYVGAEGVETTLGQVGKDGSSRRTVLPAGGRIVTSIEVSRDGNTIAMAAEAPTHARELFLLGADAQPRRVTDSNPWFADMRFAPQERMAFKARDGLMIEGILVRPLDERPGQRYPLILTVHGGPESNDSNGWLTSYAGPGQVAAARGFAVFYPNYRGSTGRGVAFSKLGQGDAAGKEFDDLVDAVDHLVEIGLADRAKVGVTGGSYGGYASAWCATRFSERFAAAVPFVGISDLVSKLGTTDIPNEEYLVHARAWPWENWTRALERSPIYWAGQSRTPTLILGGMDDPRVHPGQSLELYRYLKLRSKAPVRLVRYPGEPHGNRRAASRLDYNLRMMQWFEHYLTGPGGTPPPYRIDYEPPKPAAPTASR